MRADRLVAVLLLMQARGRVTALQIAEELEISVATARRDLEALSAAGIPVYPQSGRGGGWQLVGGARTDLTGLTSTEAQALFTLVGPAAALSPDAKAALRKLVRALPESFRSDAEAAASAVTIDTARWGRDQTTMPDAVAVLQSAVVARRVVRFGYRGGEVREVGPLGLVDKDGTWYLIATTAVNGSAGSGAGERTYRVDRMDGVSATDVAFVRRADFDLAAAWDGVVDVVESKQEATRAVVTVPSHLVDVLRSQFGRHCVVVRTDGGQAWVRVSAPAPIMIAQHLAGWGNTVRVVSPDEVRAELARLGAELVAAYPEFG